MNSKGTKFSQIENIEEVVEFINSKKFNHMHYSYYTDIYSMDSILKNKCIWLSKLDDCNDKTEKENAGGNENMFCLCWSATYSENFPMWYMYGGISGEGARLTIARKEFSKWIKEKGLTFYIWECNKEEKIEEIAPRNVRCEDILYISYDEENRKYRLKHNNESNNNVFNEDDYTYIKENYAGFYKELPWFYEKEFRIMVEVDSDIAAKLNERDSKYKLVLDINEYVYKAAEVMLGPESEILDYDKYQGFKNFALAKIMASKYIGKIKMNLLKRNRKSIIEQKKEWLYEEVAEEICQYTQKNSWCKAQSDKENTEEVK